MECVNSYARLPEAFYERTEPVPVRAPQLVLWNDALAATLGLPSDLAEPILQENKKRFVLFPLKYPEVWEMYKKAEVSSRMRPCTRGSAPPPCVPPHCHPHMRRPASGPRRRSILART